MATAQSLSISMRDFLRTGKFGEIQLGDSVEKLRDFLGEPPIVSSSSRSNPKPGIWKYGDIEFHLTHDRARVWMIYCDSFDDLKIGNSASIDNWFFRGHAACEVVERELSAAQISFNRLDMPHEPTGYLLRLGSGVELMFSTGTNPVTWPGCPGLFGFKFCSKERFRFESADRQCS